MEFLLAPLGPQQLKGCCSAIHGLTAIVGLVQEWLGLTTAGLPQSMVKLPVIDMCGTGSGQCLSGRDHILFPVSGNGNTVVFTGAD